MQMSRFASNLTHAVQILLDFLPVLLLLIASTAFYIATLPLDSAPDGTHRTSTELEPTAPER